MAKLFEPQATMTHYAMALPDGDVTILDQNELDHPDGALSDIIDEYDGVDSCDYNGHFGEFIFYRVELEYDTPELHASIIATTKEYLREIKSWPTHKK